MQFRIAILTLPILTFAISNTFAVQGESGTATIATANGTQRYTVAAGPTQVQLDRLSEKLALTQSILKNVSADADAKGATPEWREGLAASLYMISNEALQRIEPAASTLDAAHAAAQTEAMAAKIAPASADGSVAKSLGDSGNDLVFTPITPCRFIDTRNVGGPINAVRVFDTSNAGPTYGGSAGCTLSGIGQPAIALNLTIVSPKAPGYLAVRPQGSTNVTSFINWYSSGNAVQEANAGIVTTALASNGHYEFEILGDGGFPQTIVDYFGYFSAPSGTITGEGGGSDGIDGFSSGVFNSGVYGDNTGGGKGVFGASSSGQGVSGQSNTGDGMYGFSSSGSGVYGQTAGTSGQSGAAGVWGDSASYYGVWGTSNSGDGVHGNSTTASGVYGLSGGAGVWGESTGYDAVHGHTSNPNGNTSGVAGFGDGNNNGTFGISTSGSGVAGFSTSGNGVFGHSNSGFGMATDGHATQARDQGGWVKAMVDVDPQNERIVRCFNSQTSGAQINTPPCGFSLQEPSPGNTIIDFGFEVDDRFFSLSAYSGGSNGHIGINLGACAGSPNVFCSPPFPTPNQASLTTFDGDGNYPDVEIHVLVF